VETQRIMFLKVPIDIVTPEELPDVISNLLKDAEKPGSDLLRKSHNIVLLSLSDLLRARRKGEYRNYVLKASLVLPISKSIVSGARFLTGKELSRYMPFNFVINILSVLEKGYSLYLLGDGNRTLKKAEKNINITFPKINIVGRREGVLRKQEEPVVLEAIRKASPSLLLAGKGVRGKELWIARNSYRLNPGLRLWCSDLFDVFAKKKRRPSDAVFEKGLEGLFFFFRSPLRFFRIFSYMRYKLLLLIYKIFKK